MRTSTSILFIALALAKASAQCPFEPTISPDAALLCPGGSMELGTQVYDAYQWMADGLPIPSATEQFLFVDESYMGQTITVLATLDGCTEPSAPVLVDGLVFLLPYVIHGGDLPYADDGQGGSYFCVGDTFLLTLAQPYDSTITWTNAGVVVPGAVNDTLFVTTSGAWSASGAPAQCPAWVQSVGVEVDTYFTPSIQPDIVVVGDQLCPYPTGVGAQWYVNGLPVVTIGQCIDATAPGSYVVDVEYSTPCDLPSEPHLVLGVDDPSVVRGWSAYPRPASGVVFIQGPSTVNGERWALLDATGRTVLGGVLTAQFPLRLDLEGLATGRYWFLVPGERALAIPVLH